MYEHAIKIDPGFALAYAELAGACAMIYYFHDSDPKWVDKGNAACDRALELEPQLAEALASRALMLDAQKKYDEAIRWARRALEVNPNCGAAYMALGRACFESDRLQEAADVAERAIEVAGDDYNIYIPYMMVYDRLGRVEDARRLREQEIRAAEKHLEVIPEDVRARILLAIDYAYLGNQAAATRELQLAVALRPDDPSILYNAACAYGIMQKKAEALATLKRAAEVGWHNYHWAARDPDLACLHDDPEFQRLIGPAP
jgi:tetratricopeptide (TPR) repeat protein